MNIVGLYEKCLDLSGASLTDKNEAKSALLRINISGSVTIESLLVLLERAPYLVEMVADGFDMSVQILRETIINERLSTGDFNTALEKRSELIDQKHIFLKNN